MEKHRKLKKKDKLGVKDEEELNNLEGKIAEKCEELNRKKVTDNFKVINGTIYIFISGHGQIYNANI